MDGWMHGCMHVCMNCNYIKDKARIIRRNIFIHLHLIYVHNNQLYSMCGPKIYFSLYKLIESHVSNGVTHVAIGYGCRNHHAGNMKNAFFLLFFEQGYLATVNISSTWLKNCLCIINTMMEGTLSQNFYLGPSFCFMKSRK